MFEDLLRLFEAFNDLLKLQTAKVAYLTSDNALQNHFNVILMPVIDPVSTGVIMPTAGTQ